MEREQLLSYAYTYKGEFNKITEAVVNNEPWSKVQYEGNYITLADSEYPECFKQLTYAPWVLFYQGNLKLLNKPTLCFSCPRDHISQIAIHAIHQLQRTMTADKVIAASLLEHGDYLMQKMKSSLITFLGTGLDVSYPAYTKDLQKEVMENGLVMSEYPPNVQPLAHHYLWTHRLYAAVSDVVFVPEIKPRTSNLLLCSEMHEMKKPIYTMLQMKGEQLEGMKELLKFDTTRILMNTENIESVVNCLGRQQQLNLEQNSPG